MSRDMTTPIPFVSEEDAALAQERLGRLTALSRELVGAQAVALLVARLRAQTQDSLSRLMPLVDVHQESVPACANRNGTANQELPIADFLEPVEYTWTEAGFEARQALKRYSEETHADS